LTIINNETKYIKKSLDDTPSIIIHFGAQIR